MNGFQIEERGFFKKLDWNFIVPLLLLQFIGIINLYSATHGVAEIETIASFIRRSFGS